MLLRNAWYVAAWSSEIPVDKLLARTILNVPVVLWRDTNGKVVAFEDRCCHRGAPLSKGRLEGDQLRCMYHGLLFDTVGRCVEIPGQERIPPQAKVRTFPIVEKHKWIWIWVGDASLADPSLIPDTHWLDDPEWRSLEGYTYYTTNYLLIADNLLDLAHLPYVHPNTLGGDEAYAACIPMVEKLENGVRVTRWGEGIKPAPFVQKVKNYPGSVDRWNIYDFLLPSIFLMDSGMQPSGQNAKAGNRVNAAEFRSTQALTPETDESTHYFFSQPHNFAIDDPEVTLAIHNQVVTAFQEDSDMIHAQDRMLKLTSDFKMIPIGADAALSYFRWLVANAYKAEQAISNPVKIQEV
ncbi:LysR family transcriptional regulator [Pseudomonas sp. Root68]|uniref:aromatic ring-hydroxylating dioxygenase subunit alpha n=1 Tax=unclassified Pseudomonas TaxID=196821 RepID=UPI0006F5438A|nr:MULTISPECIES: aromatic ring-hydroxylating dioxygenase subunit alpha [unclassified Pseudomonas]KRB02803.1 LysR family transcriptional regulator [Pseudomonas sp. Root68]KRB70817.1 LysR family transcriptional regulator [Pseudomonas sp. Root71]